MSDNVPCRICQDIPCKRIHCIRKPYKILTCSDCPASVVCVKIFNGCHCNLVRNEIANLINERGIK